MFIRQKKLECWSFLAHEIVLLLDTLRRQVKRNLCEKLDTYVKNFLELEFSQSTTRFKFPRPQEHQSKVCNSINLSGISSKIPDNTGLCWNFHRSFEGRNNQVRIEDWCNLVRNFTFNSKVERIWWTERRTDTQEN